MGSPQLRTASRERPATGGTVRSNGRSARAALLAFSAVLAGALVMYVLAGRRYWFYLDEWDFLAGRDAGNLGDLFQPHNEHWTSRPRA